eukprot:5977525-Heterocapsa_arctica.AAC.1
MGSHQEPGRGKILREHRSQAQVPAQMPLGMWTAASPRVQQFAPCALTHRPRLRGGPHTPGYWVRLLHGWFSGVPQRSAYAQGSFR